MKNAIVNKAAASDPLEPAERERSNFVREIVQRHELSPHTSSAWPDSTPKHIVQFWDDMQQLPDDVEACMNSWRQLEQEGFEIEIFDRSSASTLDLSRLYAAPLTAYYTQKENDYGNETHRRI